ncbi:ComEC/Rec2 family competence protein [Nocardioides houyundeii]|uniref:ComEC/Rec2 family competence protein n=1 Tax=Nocardioides houyundeii TaxID=2045452 RepID=UPI001F07507A|nr:ComEC/Rec2 family competence protein [Nocardioides houyundeii]
METGGSEVPRQRDLRMPLLAVAAWGGGLVGMTVAWSGLRLLLVLGVMLGVLLVLAASLRDRPGPGEPGEPGEPAARVGAPTRRTGGATVGCAALLLGLAVTMSAGARDLHTQQGEVAALARAGASVQARLTVLADPSLREGEFSDVVVVRALVTEVAGRGRVWRVRTPVVLLGDEEWLEVPLGATVRASGRLLAADGDVAGLLRVRGGPEVLAEPDVWWRGAAVVRAGIRTAVADRPEGQRALVPSLVVGDDAGLDPALAEDFRTTGLTHLLAVSGTNLTLMVGFLLAIARLVGVRGRGRYAVGALGIVGFVLLARTEPSVVRAATMGSVALFALTRNGTDRGLRTLGVAVVALLLADPRFAVSAGFALSVLATAGILVLAPEWSAAMSRWLPRWACDAIAVPAAAQLACTPVVAALSGEVSLVAVLANLLVAPAVAPATVLGLAGGLCAVVSPALGRLVALPAAWSVGWIIAVARWGASLRTPAIPWSSRPSGLVVLTALVVATACLAPRLLARPWLSSSVLGLVLVVVLLRPLGGAPPDGWVLAACDVGQGDALVLRAGPGSAVVVDVGPDPRPVDACLHRLGVEQVPLLVLTHFHADHVDGLAGVLSGRTVGEVDVSPLAAPASAALDVRRQLEAVGVRPVLAPHLQPRRVGEVRLQQVWPPPGQPADSVTGDGANDASVVLVAEVRGVRVLLTGDVEPTAQAGLADVVGGLQVDVLKVPHHGSRHQDEQFLTGLGAEIALVSVGADNDYGHPAPGLVRLLEMSGMQVLRTDLAGDVWVLEDGGRVSTLTRGPERR